MHVVRGRPTGCGPGALLSRNAPIASHLPPPTPGLLLGLGDTRQDVLHGLACLATLHRRYGHIQVRAEGGEGGKLPPCMPYTVLLDTSRRYTCRPAFACEGPVMPDLRARRSALRVAPPFCQASADHVNAL